MPRKKTEIKTKPAKREKTPEQVNTPDASVSGSPGGEADVEMTESVDETPKTKKRKRTKAAPPVATTFSRLTSDIGDAAPVTVSYVGDTTQAAVDGAGSFTFDIRLSGVQTFRVLTSTILPQGHQYEGHQAVVIVPSKPFPLMKLSKEVRTRIWRYVLAPSGKLDGKIEISSSAGGLTAKAYTEELKPRLGPLLVNKEILAETRPILYSFHFKFTDTNTLLTFLTLVSEAVRQTLTYIEVHQYKRAPAISMFSMLSTCTAIQRLHIATGIAVNAAPAKAVKAFHTEAQRFLGAMATIKGSKEAGLDVVKFGRSAKAFSVKEDDEVRGWTEEEKAEFHELLKGKMK